MRGDGAELLDIYGALDEMHAWRGWHWWPDADPFEVCVGSILVQNTLWANVERALERLTAAGALTPEAMGRLGEGELEELVRPSGQYRQKARKLREFLGVVARHGSLERLLALPAGELRAELLGTWGIGQETADCIVLYGSRQMAYVMDAYGARVFSRLGMGPGEAASYATWQQWLAERLAPERDLWARYHALIVMHCKHLCRKRSPKCGECRLRGRCEYFAAGRAG